MSNGVEISQHDRVTVVSLDRADVRNAVDAVTAQALHEAFVAFENDAEARVAVFHGANGHFCAGWDLQAGALIDPDSMRRVELAFALTRPAEARQPVSLFVVPMDIK